MNRAIFTAPLAILVSVGFLAAAAGPASAKADSCTAEAQQLRGAALSADETTGRQALRHIDVAVKLCEAGNERAAGKKFAAAASILAPSGDAQLADAR